MKVGLNAEGNFLRGGRLKGKGRDRKRYEAKERGREEDGYGQTRERSKRVVSYEILICR